MDDIAYLTTATYPSSTKSYVHGHLSTWTKFNTNSPPFVGPKFRCQPSVEPWPAWVSLRRRYHERLMNGMKMFGCCGSWIRHNIQIQRCSCFWMRVQSTITQFGERMVGLLPALVWSKGPRSYEGSATQSSQHWHPVVCWLWRYLKDQSTKNGSFILSARI